MEGIISKGTEEEKDNLRGGGYQVQSRMEIDGRQGDAAKKGRQKNIATICLRGEAFNLLPGEIIIIIIIIIIIQE